MSLGLILAIGLLPHLSITAAIQAALGTIRLILAGPATLSQVQVANDTYWLRPGDGQNTIINGLTSNGGPTGQLDLGSNVTAVNKLWFTQSGENLVIQVLGSGSAETTLTIKNWFFASGNYQLQDINLTGSTTAGVTGGIDSQIGAAAITALAQAMTTYQDNNPNFNPLTATGLPSDPTLQAALNTYWSRTIVQTAGDTVLSAAADGNATNVNFNTAVGEGNDTLVWRSGVTNMYGGMGDDTFDITAAGLAAGTVIIKGESETNTLDLTTAGTIAATAFTNAQGQNLVIGINAIDLAAGTNSLTLANSVFTLSGDNQVTVYGNTGADYINSGAETAGNSLVFVDGGGTDNIRGGDGNDIFEFTAYGLTATDKILGGAGFDIIDFTTAGTIASTAFTLVQGIDGIELASGTNSLTLTSNLIAYSNNGTFTIDGSEGSDLINASAETAGQSLTFVSGGGVNTLQFSVSGFSSKDTIKGSGLDTLDFTTTGTIAAATFANTSGIDAINLHAGVNSLTLTNALVASASGHGLTVTAAGGRNTIDGSQVNVPNTVTMVVDAGTNTLIGGQRANIYEFEANGGNLTINNTIAGVNGAHNQLLFGAGDTEQNLWFSQSGQNLVIDQMGSTNTVTINGWYNGAAGHLNEITGGDGLMIDGQLQNLVNSMASYATAHPNFNPQTATQMPQALEGAIANAWHH